MRVASMILGVAVLLIAARTARAEDKERPAKRREPPLIAEPAYAVRCRVVGLMSAENAESGKQEPISFTIPRMVVSRGGTAGVVDKSETTFSFGDGFTFQGKRAPIQRTVGEGSTIEATVIGQDDKHVVLDLALEFSSADSPGEAQPVRVDFFKARWIQRVELNQPVELKARDVRLEVSVSLVDETDATAVNRPNTKDAVSDAIGAKIAYVKFVGTRLKERHLRKQAGLKTGQPLDAAKVAAGRDRLLEYYREKGYPDATIEIVEGTRPDDGGVVYQIDDGEKAQRAL